MKFDSSKEYEGAIVHEDGSLSDAEFHAELLESAKGQEASHNLARASLLAKGWTPGQVVAALEAHPAALKQLGKSAVRERQIDFVLQEEFAANPAFIGHFLTLCGGKQAAEKDKAIVLESLASVRDKTGETDLLVSYRLVSDSAETRRVLLIENKVGAVFGARQAERYRERGESGVREHLWTHFETCLIAPQNYIGKQHGFNHGVSLEAILPFLEPESVARRNFKENVFRHAIEEQQRQGLKEEDPALTAFRLAYFQAYQNFLASLDQRTRSLMLDIIPPKPRKAWWDDTWFEFRSPSFGRTVYITHKAQANVVDLTFRNTEAEKLRSRVSIAPEMKIKQTGKSAAVRMPAPFIDCHSDLLLQSPQLQEAFLAVTKLTLFFKEHPELHLLHSD